MHHVSPSIAVSRMQEDQERRERLQTEECPRGSGARHRFERWVREHPTKPDRQQDAMICATCGVVLYPWKTFGGRR